ncbi:MAG: PIG-L family deacetylase [Solirubrobacterales bacterium]|nr:PIG-L family deacetylase [Solirubrobacterales bacterium]
MILAISPHLDDAVFSIGGTLAQAAAGGEQVLLATVFTRSVLSPTGFALACQLDKDLGSEVDYMAVRRREDQLAAERLSFESPLHLGLPEAPHRGYDSARELFAGPRSDDSASTAVAEALGRLLEQMTPDRVLCPLGVGAHVDHLVVIEALDRLGVTTERWRDVPYVLRDADPAHVANELRVSLSERPVGLSEAELERKLDACAAYATQLGFQFGGEQPMRRAIRAFADTEGARLGCDGPAEALSLVSASGGAQRLRTLDLRAP